MDPRLEISRLRVLRHYRTVLAAVPVCVALIPISVVGACQWRAVREAEVKGALARDLIERGLTAAEAERLVYGPPERTRMAEVKKAEVEAAMRVLRQNGVSPEEAGLALRSGAGNPAVPALMPAEP